MWSLFGLVLGTILTTGTASCSPSILSDNQAVQTSARNLTATEKDNGGRLELHPDDVLTLKLESIPGTGYSWQISKNDARVMGPLDKPEYERKDKKTMGVPEYQIFRLKALAKGANVLEMQYKRVWEKGKEPLKIFRVTVRIN